MKAKASRPEPQDQGHEPPVGGRHQWLFTLALGLTLFFSGVAIWHSWASYRGFEKTVALESRLVEDSGLIGQLDEALTMSARMAAATGDPQWEQRYTALEPQLDAAIQEARRLAPDVFDSEAARLTEEANRALVALEHRALALVRQGQRAAAGVLLSSPEYEAGKETYAQGLRQLRARLGARDQAFLTAERRRLTLFLALAAAALPVLLLAWAVALHAARQNAADRWRAGERLHQAEAKYRSIFDNAAEGIFQTTPEGRFLMANPAMARILGFASPEELIRERTDIVGQGYMHPEQREEFKRRMEQQGTVPGFEYEAQRKDGRVVWVSETAWAVRDAAGLIVCYEGIFEDITERKRAEEALRASLQVIEGIINAIPVRVFWKDKNLVYLGCNAAFARDAGFADPKDIIGKDDYQMGWRDQAESYRGEDRQVIESGDSKLLIEETQTTPEGNTITLLTNKIPLRSSKGEISGILGTYMDITERKRAEETLRTSENKYRRLIEGAPDIIYAFSSKRGGFYYSPRVESILGYSAQYLLEHPQLWQNSIDPAHLGETHLAIQKFMSGEPFDIEYRIKDSLGKWHWLRDRSIGRREEGDEIIIEGIATDITEHKQAEEELKKRNAFIETILANAPIGFAVNTISDGQFMFVGRNFEKIYGMPPDSLRSVDDFFEKVYLDPVFREKIRERVMADMATGEASRMRWENVPITTLAGEHRVVTATNLPLPEQNLMISTVQDVTEQWRAKEAQRDAEVRYRLLFEHSPDGIVIIDPATARLLEFNETAHRQLGYSREEFARLSISDFEATETPEQTRARIASVTQEGRSDFETRHRTRQGEIRDIQVTAQLTELQGHSVYHCVWRDITERSQAKAELRKLSMAVNASNEVIFMTDLEGVIRSMNPAFTHLYGYAAAEVVGKTTPRILKSGTDVAGGIRVVLEGHPEQASGDRRAD
jgi:PAS domain S-box-containing protein